MKKERKQDEKKYGCIHPPPVHRPLRWGYSAFFLDKWLVYISSLVQTSGYDLYCCDHIETSYIYNLNIRYELKNEE